MIAAQSVHIATNGKNKEEKQGEEQHVRATAAAITYQYTVKPCNDGFERIKYNRLFLPKYVIANTESKRKES